MGRKFREQVIDLDLGKADVVEAAPEQAHRAVMEGRTVQSSASFELMADGRESQRCAFRQFFLPEKWLLRSGCWQCAFFVTELSRPLRGRDNRALKIHEL